MKSLISTVFLSAAVMVSAQGFKAYLPAASAAKASSYLAVIDSANSSIRTRRAAVRSELLEAEAQALSAFAVLIAAENGEEWADPEGTLTSSRARDVFVEARSRALRAASALSSGSASVKTPGIEELETKRAEAAEKLRTLLRTASLGLKSAAGVDRLLSERMARGGGLFPEILEVQAYLRKAGAKGCILSARAVAEGREDLAAAALLSETDAILALVPAASPVMESLAAAYGAYSAWVSGFALASCPGMLGSFEIPEREPFAQGIAALASLEPQRASALIAAMEKGDGRDAAAASAARRLAAVWESLGAAQRRRVSLECAVPVSTFACFASALAPRAGKPAAVSVPSPEAILLSLNALAAAMADQASAASVHAAEPALLLLEKPELAAAARTEARYASLYAACSGRLDAIYRRSAEESSGLIEGLPAVKKAAAKALGSVPASIVVEAVDMKTVDSGLERRLAFVAVAKDGEGRIVRFPVKAEVAADVYARSFAKAAGVSGTSAAYAQKLLQKYGTCLFTAYDPARTGDRLVLSSYPSSPAAPTLSVVDMEREILEGWKQ